jgi:signal transduction histidine kinase
MLDFIRAFLDGDSLSPHGICLLWRPELIWTHVVADTLIGLAYFSIPIVLAVFVSKRRDVAFGWVFWCFAAFILACGTTHFFSIWTLWNPDYALEAVIKAATAGISVVTAAALWPLLPRALALPSPAQLKAANDALVLTLAERDAALEALHRETAERLRAEDMLRQAQKMEALGQLTGGVAHDFNNLLTVVIANLERVERRMAPGQEDLRQAVANAMTGADRAAALTQQLLAFARKQPLQPRSHEADGLVAGMGDLLRRTLGERIALDIRLGGEAAPAVRVDRNQLENAILNLAVNARDAMPGGGRLTIATRPVGDGEAALHPDLAPGTYAVIEVRDTGCGMTREVAERVFEPFFTTKPLGQGTGLGLSQVYGFVKQSGGHVAVESRVGLGTTVRLFLPAAQAPEAGAEPADAAGAEAV